MRDRIIDIVQRYLGAYHPSGDENVSTACPFHETKSGTPFSVNVVRGLYHCFTCGESGTIIQLVQQLGQRGGLSPTAINEETDGLQAILIQVREEFQRVRNRAWDSSEDPFAAETILSEAVIAHWKLQCPSNLLAAGFTEAILQYSEVGFDENKARVIYPIRDIYGNLAGVSGGTIYAGTQPKYKVYEGPRHGPRGEPISSDYGMAFDERYPDYYFGRSRYLWNYHRVYPRLFFGKEVQPLIIVVEGFKAALWMLQHGWWNVVALMGSKISQHQTQLLCKPDCRYLLFLDNDEAGRQGTIKAGKELSSRSAVEVARYPEGADDCQPDDLQPEWLHYAVSRPIPFGQFHYEENRHGSR